MASTQAEDTHIEALRVFVKKWGVFFAAVGAGVGVFYEHKGGIEALKAALGQMRADLDAFHSEYRDAHSFGPGGFLNPQIRAGLDASIREFLRSYNAEMEDRNRRWRANFFQLNPMLRSPAE